MTQPVAENIVTDQQRIPLCSACGRGQDTPDCERREHWLPVHITSESAYRLLKESDR